MTAAELKAQLHTLIEQEDSLEKLEAVQALLNQEEEYVSPPREKEELQRSVARSEADIKAGRVHTLAEVETQMDKFWEERAPR